ncbi:membrane protein insertion efficiency factor YidD [Collibacillus ludicampi]|uniref:membrane protein insertion efficiency factor YidD n=1 Tax=Collibacillus ludicampi TaxID=2771369 RepID=UPI0034E226C1
MFIRLCLRLIAWYQRKISPKFGRRCRFEPTCSEYARLALLKYGIWKGIAKTAKRLARCNRYYHGSKIDYP